LSTRIAFTMSTLPSSIKVSRMKRRGLACPTAASCEVGDGHGDCDGNGPAAR
jgi:hypothetical protein